MIDPTAGLCEPPPDEPRGAAARRAAVLAADDPRGMWDLRIGHPGAVTDYRRPLVPTPTHTPTVLVRLSLKDDDGQTPAAALRRYRGACLGCDWEGRDRADHGEAGAGEAAAIQDAHDHAWPGWRDLPAVSPPPGPRARERWLARVTLRYPRDWWERGGPIVVRRPERTWPTHHQAPGGGYEITRLEPEPEQLRLL